MVAPQGASVTYRYPFLRRDAGTAAPMFGAAVAIPALSTAWSTEFPTLTPAAVWQPAVPGPVLAAAFTSDFIHLLELSADGRAWVHRNSTRFISALRR